MSSFKITKNRFLKVLLKTLGVFFVILGVIGIIIPLLPTTPFLLLAAWFFMRSSEKLYNWMRTNKLFGKYLKNYMDGNGIPLKIKTVVFIFLWLVLGIPFFFVFSNLFVKIVLIVIGVAVSIHLIMLKTYKGKSNEIYR